MCSNLTNHQLKIDCYKDSLVYMKHIVTTNQKPTKNIQEIKRKESKHDTIESHQQHTREQSKRIKMEQERTTKQSENNKMAITTYLLVIINVNGLNAAIRRQRVAEWIRKQDPQICCYERPTSKDTHRQKGMEKEISCK